MFHSRIIARLDFRISSYDDAQSTIARCSQFSPEVTEGISSSYGDAGIFEVAIARQKQRNNSYCTWDTVALYCCDVREVELGRLTLLIRDEPVSP